MSICAVNGMSQVWCTKRAAKVKPRTQRMQTPLAHHFECVLVTGGAGFIGSNFLLRMVPRYPNVHFVNLDALTYAGNLLSLKAIEAAPNYTFVHGDVADLSLLAKLFEQHRFTTVVHFAAESHVDRSIRDPLAFVRSNTVGTVALHCVVPCRCADGVLSVLPYFDR